MSSSDLWPVILGSRSPRRRELLSLLVPQERITILPPSDPEELGFDGLSDDDSIRTQLLRIARDKNENVRQRPECPATALVLTADTIIVAGSPGCYQVLGQPPESPQWHATVRHWFRTFYADQTHRALTGVVLSRIFAGQLQRSWTCIVSTEVSMGPMTDEQIDWYLGTGEPIGKAGGYALQGAGSIFITQVTGSLSNVVGLPLEAVQALLIEAGIPGT